MRVLSLLKHIGVNKVLYNHKIENITDSSKSCTYNSIFVAIKGNRIDGSLYIDEAIKLGARTIILSGKKEEKANVNYIYVDDTKRMLAVLLYYYNYRYLKKIKFIGIIGTNGKSTTAYNIYSMLNYFNYRTALIGTDGFHLKKEIIKHNNTTPNVCLIYEYIKMSINKKAKYIVMELSSVASNELRFHMIKYDILVFTNFSEDHLDYHKTLDNYFQNKLIPFIELNHNGYAIINKDDNKYYDIIKHIKGRVISYSVNKHSMYKANNILFHRDSITFKVNGKYYKYYSLGLFNIYNLLPLFYLKDLFKLNNDRFKEFINFIKPPKGRMDLIKYHNSYIVIDYAHTEDGVKNVVDSILRLPHNKVYVVIGCGGNREKEKREKIGKILSDSKLNIVLTNDNPRFEDPISIVNDIAKGISIPYVVILDRTDAIKYAVGMLEENDYLLVIGKGNEGYIEIAGKKIPYNDYDVINDILTQ